MNQKYIISLFFLFSMFGISEAAFNVYLKNGSIISGISSYESKNGEVILYMGGGSIGIDKADIFKIQETGAQEVDIRVKEEEKKEIVSTPPLATEQDNEIKIRMLQDELDNITSEIRKLEAEEGRLVTEINEKRGRRFKYNIYQLRQLEKETEPLQQELFSVQQRKNELLQRRSAIEAELRGLQR